MFTLTRWRNNLIRLIEARKKKNSILQAEVKGCCSYLLLKMFERMSNEFQFLHMNAIALQKPDIDKKLASGTGT